MNYFGKIFGAAAFIICLSNIAQRPLYSSIMVDLSGRRYSEAAAFVSNLAVSNVTAVVVGSPFKAYSGARVSDNLVYDVNDTGEVFQRGTFETYYGNLESLKRLVNQLEQKKIALYAWVNPFFQRESYKKEVWANEDFLPESVMYSDRYIVDIHQSAARAKMDKMMNRMKELPVQKWVADLRDIPPKLYDEYSQYLKSALGQSVLIVSDRSREISGAYYWELRQKAFIMPSADFDALDSIQVPDISIHFIESASLSVNNIASLAYLLYQKLSVLVPSDMLSKNQQELVNTLSIPDNYSKLKLQKDRMLIYSDKRLFAYHFGGSFALVKLQPLFPEKGIFKSRIGSGMLISEKKNLSLFLYPASVLFWDLTRKD